MTQHPALFGTVVSQPNYWMNKKAQQSGAESDLSKAAPMTRLLLDRGADPNIRASLRKQLHPGYGEDTLHEYRDVTPLSWGQRFHNQRFVSQLAMQFIAQSGGRS